MNRIEWVVLYAMLKSVSKREENSIFDKRKRASLCVYSLALAKTALPCQEKNVNFVITCV